MTISFQSQPTKIAELELKQSRGTFPAAILFLILSREDFADDVEVLLTHERGLPGRGHPLYTQAARFGIIAIALWRDRPGITYP